MFSNRISFARRQLWDMIRYVSPTTKNFSQATKEKTGLLKLAKLDDRKIFRIKGKDSSKYLQGLITNDVTSLVNEKCGVLFTMFLNAQGRVLYDAMLYTVPGEQNEYFIETDSKAVEDAIKLLKMFKLRAKVEFSDASNDVEVWALFSDEGPVDIGKANSQPILAHKDPRLNALGMRIIVPWKQSPADHLTIGPHIPVGSAVYKEHRHKLGIAEGTDEIPCGNALPLEYNLALINGVSFSKGCYVGQELTARTHHVGQIRKRIMPLQLKYEGEFKEYPEFSPQTSIKTDSGKSAGRLCVMNGEYGLGLLRLKEVSESSFLVLPDVNGKEVQLTPSVPNWWPKDS